MIIASRVPGFLPCKIMPGSCVCKCNGGQEGSGCAFASACTASPDSSKNGTDGVLHGVNDGTVGGLDDLCDVCGFACAGFAPTSHLPNLPTELGVWCEKTSTFVFL